MGRTIKLAKEKDRLYYLDTRNKSPFLYSNLSLLCLSSFNREVIFFYHLIGVIHHLQLSKSSFFYYSKDWILDAFELAKYIHTPLLFDSQGHLEILIYLSHTWLYIAYSVSVVSQLMQDLKDVLL